MRVSRSLVCGNVVFDRERGAEFVNSPSGSLNQKRCIAGYGVLELLRRVPQPGRVEEDPTPRPLDRGFIHQDQCVARWKVESDGGNAPYDNRSSFTAHQHEG